ncbi:MAG: hypothetical protein SFT81_00955 [Candidatus Caenarcaniphilales bacterium]|nr:hypothetical protein [Candidatus Caenarcaniphilales bacterium]
MSSLYHIEKEVPVRKNNFLLELLVPPPSAEAPAKSVKDSAIVSGRIQSTTPSHSSQKEVKELFNSLKNEMATKVASTPSASPERELSHHSQSVAAAPSQSWLREVLRSTNKNTPK